MPRAHIYVRVSSEGQINLPGHCSLDTQERNCRNYCQEKGLDVVQVWSEVCSARDMNEMKIQKRMFSALRHGDTIVFYNITRFSRNTFQGLSIIKKLQNKKRINFYSVAEECSYNQTAQKHLFRSTLSVAENESDMISDRVNASLAYRRSIGSEIGAAPYGKEPYFTNEGVRKFRENQAEMRVIDTILEKHYNGDSAPSISEFLNENRLFKRHYQWSDGMVRRIIKNFARLRTRDMIQAIDEIAAYADSSSESESSEESEESEEQPIAKRVKRDIRQRSRERSRSPARGAPLRFKKRQEEGQ